MAAKKKKSGGKRAVEKKHAERNAQRARAAGGAGDWQTRWLNELKELEENPPKTAAESQGWLGRAAVVVVRATLRDVGLPFEQLRRDAMQQIERASKVLNPAKLSEELAELERALEELRNASDVTPRANRPASSPADLS